MMSNVTSRGKIHGKIHEGTKTVKTTFRIRLKTAGWARSYFGCMIRTFWVYDQDVMAIPLHDARSLRRARGTLDPDSALGTT
jgi:hypothetical protein